MRRGLDVFALLTVIGVALYLYFYSKNPPYPIIAPLVQNPSASQTGTSPNAPIVSSAKAGSNSPGITSSQFEAQPGSLAARAGKAAPEAGPPAELPPETVMQNVRRAIHQYGEMFGGNPVGTNPEITSQLSGNNPKHINFITTQAGMKVDAEGELVDAWGTPYFFHQISGAEMEVHSAGPDKIMWTSDDLVVK
jgi:hypothetical protein